jgi:hypothetical protein
MNKLKFLLLAVFAVLFSLALALIYQEPGVAVYAAYPVEPVPRPVDTAYPVDYGEEFPGPMIIVYDAADEDVEDVSVAPKTMPQIQSQPPALLRVGGFVNPQIRKLLMKSQPVYHPFALEKR